MIDIMVRDYKCYRFPRLEGDDVMGLLMTGTQGHNYVGITSDKDIYTLPGTAMRLNHDKTFRKSSVLQADKFWMTQTITGDPVDGYKGAPGAGIKAADKALAEKSSLRSMWDAVLHVYADQFDHKRWGKDFVTKRAYDEALMNARCARILRHGDYDHKTGEVKLWTP
jgi:DNA polymerase-1